MPMYWQLKRCKTVDRKRAIDRIARCNSERDSAAHCERYAPIGHMECAGPGLEQIRSGAAIGGVV